MSALSCGASDLGLPEAHGRTLRELQKELESLKLSLSVYLGPGSQQSLVSRVYEP